MKNNITVEERASKYIENVIPYQGEKEYSKLNIQEAFLAGYTQGYTDSISNMFPPMPEVKELPPLPNLTVFLTKEC